MFEPEEMRGFTTVLAAWIRKAGRDDPEALAQMVQLLDEARVELVAAAQELNDPVYDPAQPARRGYSWAQIGAALGVSRATAWERFAPKAVQS